MIRYDKNYFNSLKKYIIIELKVKLYYNFKYLTLKNSTCIQGGSGHEVDHPKF